MAEPFPDDVRRFVLAHLNSVEQLEVLLLLRGAPEREWTADAVGRALYTSPAAAAAQRLADLAAGQLLATHTGPEPVYRYAPADDARRQLIDRLADAYRERRVAFITLIYSKPNDQPASSSSGSGTGPATACS
jgi:hypothetical protein